MKLKVGTQYPQPYRIGAVLPLPLQEGLRLALGDAFKHFPALEFAYGVMLVLSIIYMPKGIHRAALELRRRPRTALAARA